MLNDIKNCRELGVKGIVIGALNLNKTIDRDTMLRMKDVAKELEITCHRAFDDSFDWKNSMDLLIETGINRILSSGLSSSVELGLPILAEMMNYAKSRIEIMVGGGVNLGNVQRILLDVQPDAIHFSGTSKLILDENSYFSETLLQLDKGKVEKLIHSIRG